MVKNHNIGDVSHNKKQCFFFICFFLFFFVFFTLIHPLYVFDTDDWINMGLKRSFFPNTSFYNPIKILPEILFPMVSFLGARILYPLSGDYITSLSVSVSFIFCTVILVNALCLRLFYSYIKDKIITDKNKDYSFIVACLVAIFFMSLFFFCRNNDYFLREANVTCIFHYSIPAILNFSVTLLLIVFESDNKQILFFNSLIKNVFWGIIIYLCIFSNLFFSSVLLSYVVFLCIKRAVYFRIEQKKLLHYFFQNYQYLLVIFIWILSAYYEAHGVRASRIGLNNHITFNNIVESFVFWSHDSLHQVASVGGGKTSFLIILLFLSANILLFVRFLRKQILTTDMNFFFIQIKIFWIVLFIVLYQILVTVKTGIGYQLRPSMIYCWFVWLLLDMICCFLYLSSFFYKLNGLIPFILITELYMICIIKPVLLETNSLPSSNIISVKQFGNDLIKTIENADRKGEKTVELHVPKFNSKDNFPIAIYAEFHLANTLYLQGITKKLLNIKLVPDEKMNKLYCMP